MSFHDIELPDNNYLTLNTQFPESDCMISVEKYLETGHKVFILILCARYLIYFKAVFSNIVQIYQPRHFLKPMCHPCPWLENFLMISERLRILMTA